MKTVLFALLIALVSVNAQAFEGTQAEKDLVLELTQKRIRLPKAMKQMIRDAVEGNNGSSIEKLTLEEGYGEVVISDVDSEDGTSFESRFTIPFLLSPEGHVHQAIAPIDVEG